MQTAQTVAQPGDTVHVHYTGRLDDGSVFDASEGRDPLAFTLGQGQVIAGFDDAIAGMEVGATKTVRIPADEAYGARRDDLLIEVPRTQLPDGLEVEVGMQLQLRREDGGAMPVTVADTAEGSITLDANHPLAGQALTFDLQLVAIA
jgi:FKBP-type peptidyl-prolyl cis-trans isomerase 2